MVLDALHVASRVSELDVPSFGLHALKGDRASYFAIVVTRNWRITFRFVDAVENAPNADEAAAVQEIEAEEIQEEKTGEEDNATGEETGAHQVDYEDYH